MNQKIIFPVLGLFIIAAGLTGFWLYKDQAFAESDIPDIPTEKVNLELMEDLSLVAIQDIEAVEKPAISEDLEKAEDVQNLENDEEVPALEALEGAARYFTQEGSDYMRKYLLEPSEKLNDFIDEDMMSRCGSGAYYQIYKEPTSEKPYFFGEVNLSKGCGQDEKFFTFRVSPDGLTLEIGDEAIQNYVPYNEWFKTAKPIF